MRALTLDAPEIVRAHKTPGQFVTLRLGDEEGVFALANAPGEPLEVLVKRAGGVSVDLARVAAGDTLLVGAPSGPGFPLAQHEGRDLLLLAAGTGIAPIRAVVRCLLEPRARWGRVDLYYGQRAEDGFAFADEHAAWCDAGLAVNLIASDADRTAAWTGARGRVQDVLRAAPPANLNDAVVYLCGMASMVTDVTATLASLGHDPADLFLNL